MLGRDASFLVLIYNFKTFFSNLLFKCQLQNKVTVHICSMLYTSDIFVSIIFLFVSGVSMGYSRSKN